MNAQLGTMNVLAQESEKTWPRLMYKEENKKN